MVESPSTVSIGSRFHAKQLVKICRGKNLLQVGIQVNNINVGLSTASMMRLVKSSSAINIFMDDPFRL